METAETLELKAVELRDEMLKIKCHVDELEDIALSTNDCELGQQLRRISAEIRRSLDFMQDLLAPDQPWLVG